MAKRIKAEPEKVVVVWKAHTPGYYNVLSFRDGPRIYYRDQLDPRCGELPYVATIAELAAREGVGSASSVQLPLVEAMRNGLV